MAQVNGTNGHKRAFQSSSLLGIALIAIGVLALSGFVLPFVSGLFWGLFWTVGLAVVAYMFYNMYRADTTKWGWLIPAYAMAAISGLIVLSTVVDFIPFLPGDIVPAYVFVANALPWLYVYSRNRKNWWALIPGGLFSLMALGFLIGATIEVLPVIMIVAGVYILFRYWRQDKSAQPEAVVATGAPVADR